MEAPLLLPISTAAPAASSSVDIDDITVDVVPTPAPAPSSSRPSTQSIVFRVVTVVAVACASLFVQHEAAKGFGIDVVSAGGGGGGADRRRLDLFFVSNSRAKRILHHASSGVEGALFPDASFPRKQVRCVTVRLAGHNLTVGATVDAAAAPGEYVVSLSPVLVFGTGADAADAVAAAVRRAVARMWLWDGCSAAPAPVTEAMVEYLASTFEVAAAASLSSENGEHRQCISAWFLRHLEGQRDHTKRRCSSSSGKSLGVDSGRGPRGQAGYTE